MAVQSRSEGRITLFTIGFTRKNARSFFSLLTKAGVKKVIDVRLNNASQLAGFAKGEDLEYFLREIADIDYVYRPDLTPTKQLLDDYREKRTGWPGYEERFSQLLEERRPETMMTPSDLDHACLLCSEATAEQCHRRLVAEYLAEKLGNLDIRHLQ